LGHNKFKRYTVTAALPYTNGPVHIGHLAGVYIPADIYVRYLRSKGRDVIFVCGSDEHGVPITLKARKEGIQAQQVVDKYHKIIGDSFRDFGVSFNIYHRTSSETHHDTASGFFRSLYDKGVFNEEETEQYFDEKAGQFLADRYIIGTCPNCGNEEAYGDQCEKCGTSLSPTELINPRSTLSGAQPVLKKTLNWFLPLDKMQPQIEAYIDSHKEWRPNVYGQCKSWLSGGLHPRAMTRDLDWGVKVPVEGADGKVLYVWFEAPIGYISATKELRPTDWEQWWTGDTKLVHFIGKDNIVFHCIIFPAMLHLRGDGYVVPTDVPANEFLNLEGQKISTSRNWAVWLNEYLVDLPNRQDELRYVLTSIAPETKDSEFTWKDYQTRVNSELVGIYGNFANRVLVLINKYYEGKVPAKTHQFNSEELCNQYITPIAKLLSEYKFRDAQFGLMELARFGNKFLAEQEPWKLIKTDEAAAASVLQFACEILLNLAELSEVFLPRTSANLLGQLNIQISESDKTQFWKGEKWLQIPENHTISEVSLLFQKIEDDVIEAQMNKLQQSLIENQSATTPKVAEAKVVETKAEIQYEDFAKLDLRVAKVLTCEKVEKADKLLKLTLEVGTEIKTVVSGIALHFAPEEVIGKSVLYLSNLAPRKMKGIESQGMILMAENSDGKLYFMQPSGDVDSGSGVS
jgi:methionyl-tRNA synthetase